MRLSSWSLAALGLLALGCPPAESTECLLAVRDCRADEACVNGACVPTGSDSGTDARADGAVDPQDGAVEPRDGSAPDATGGECGSECDTGLRCEVGIMDCSGDEPRCVRASLRPLDTVCREAGGECDADDVCDGASGGCAARRAPIGTPCDGGFCDGSGACGACSVGAPCQPSACETGAIACSPDGIPSCTATGAMADGTVCGDETTGAWGACVWAGACAQTGTQERQVDAPGCQAGACTVVSRTESQACARATEGNGCGASVPGAWSACTGMDMCGLAGMQTRNVDDMVCRSGGCAAVGRSETQACARATDGNSCGAPTFGPWGPCNFTSCGLSGTQTRSVMQPTCGGGACGSVNSTGSQACTRASSNGGSCGATTWGEWGMCVAFSCDPNMATRFRSGFTYTCNASGMCVSTEDAFESEMCGTIDVVGSFCTTAPSGFGTCTAPFTCV